jgi:hypothetical protein
MTYTSQELEVFKYCFTLLAEGCKTSHEAEKALYKAFHWMTPLEAQRFIKVWIRDRQKIDETLRQLKEAPQDFVRNVEVHSAESTPGYRGYSYASSQSI